MRHKWLALDCQFAILWSIGMRNGDKRLRRGPQRGALVVLVTGRVSTGDRRRRENGGRGGAVRCKGAGRAVAAVQGSRAPGLLEALRARI